MNIDYQRSARLLAWIGIFGIIILSVVPASDRPTVAEALLGQSIGHLLDHVAAFSLVAAVFAVGYRFSLLQLLGLAFCFCAGVELLQVPLSTRHARISDLAIDFVASSVAAAIVRWRQARAVQ